MDMCSIHWSEITLIHLYWHAVNIYDIFITRSILIQVNSTNHVNIPLVLDYIQTTIITILQIYTFEQYHDLRNNTLHDLDIICMINCFKGESSKHPVFFSWKKTNSQWQEITINDYFFKKDNASTELCIRNYINYSSFSFLYTQ